jgi:hypothetical protein
MRVYGLVREWLDAEPPALADEALREEWAKYLAITVLGGGLGILSVLGASDSVIITAGIPWLLALAALFILGGAVLDLVCLARGYRYTSHMPRIDVYNSQTVLNNPNMRPRVATSLIEGYVTYSNDLTAVNSQKSRLLKSATVALVAGVILLVANAAWAEIHPRASEIERRLPLFRKRGPLYTFP